MASAHNRLTKDEVAKLRAAISKEVIENPPTIGLVGVSGVGKSYTINTLFKTNLPTSDTVACTKEFESIDLALKFTSGEMKELPVQLRVIDAPGLGEDVYQDPNYLQMYSEHLPACDVILWILAARNRAMALDQSYLSKLESFHDRMVFAINQVDIVEPMDWNRVINLPSEKQLENIDTIVADRESKLSQIIGVKTKVEPYSAKHGYRLEELFTAIITTTKMKRRWILDNLKNFNFRDFIPKELLAKIEKRENMNT